jgi:ketosteroid isomerase-like protein
MRTVKTAGWKTSIFVLIALAIVAALFFHSPAMTSVGEGMVTQETLLDRIQIEDLLVLYYGGLGAGESHDLAQFFTEDAVLDVNGQVSKGRKEIEALYGGLEAGGTDQPTNRMHVLLNNPIIKVQGDTAKAWVIWTGVVNDSIRMAPRLQEQGREYTELVKREGRWLIRKRYITADSGMPALWDETYKPREFK